MESQRFVSSGGPLTARYRAIEHARRHSEHGSGALVRLVRSGGPGFVPFLFPGFMSASEATDMGRVTNVRGNHLQSAPTDITSGGNALTCNVLLRRSACGESFPYDSIASFQAEANRSASPPRLPLIIWPSPSSPSVPTQLDRARGAGGRRDHQACDRTRPS